jgi:hypothetical protein
VTACDGGHLVEAALMSPDYACDLNCRHQRYNKASVITLSFPGSFSAAPCGSETFNMHRLRNWLLRMTLT